MRDLLGRDLRRDLDNYITGHYGENQFKSVKRKKKPKINYETKVARILTKFYEATMTALFRQNKGHSDGWAKVQKLSDKIEDDYNLDEFLN